MRLKFEVIHLEVSGRCQLNCPYCYSRSGTELAVSEWQALVKELAPLTKQFTLGGGEPFLYDGLGGDHRDDTQARASREPDHERLPFERNARPGFRFGRRVGLVPRRSGSAAGGLGFARADGRPAHGELRHAGPGQAALRRGPGSLQNLRGPRSSRSLQSTLRITTRLGSLRGRSRLRASRSVWTGWPRCTAGRRFFTVESEGTVSPMLLCAKALGDRRAGESFRMP